MAPWYCSRWAAWRWLGCAWNCPARHPGWWRAVVWSIFWASTRGGRRHQGAVIERLEAQGMQHWMLQLKGFKPGLRWEARNGDADSNARWGVDDYVHHQALYMKLWIIWMKPVRMIGQSWPSLSWRCGTCRQMELMVGSLSIFDEVGAEQKPMPTPDLSDLESLSNGLVSWKPTWKRWPYGMVSYSHSSTTDVISSSGTSIVSSTSTSNRIRTTYYPPPQPWVALPLPLVCVVPAVECYAGLPR